MRIPILPTLLACATGFTAARCARAGHSGRQADSVPAQAEAIYQKGLRYLASAQGKNGSWNDGSGQVPGVVGLCVAAFLAHGEDPVNGPYASHIRKGLEFILSKQNKTNGYIGSSM